MNRTQLAIYGLLALIWGFSFLLLLRVVETFGWVGAVSIRAFVVTGVVAGAAVVTRRPLRFAGSWRLVVVLGATTVAGQLVGLSLATPRIGTSMAALLVATIPLFSLLIGQVLKVEHVTRPQRIGLLLGVVGIGLLVGFPAVPVTGDFLFGCACSLFGCFCAAFGSNWARWRMGHIGAWEQTAGAFLVAGVMTLPLLLVVPVPGPVTLTSLGYLVALAAICSALAYTLYFRLVADVGATLAISVEFVVPVMAVIVGAVVLGERLTVPQLAGGAVIIAGCSMVVGLLPIRRRRSGAAAAPAA